MNNIPSIFLRCAFWCVLRATLSLSLMSETSSLPNTGWDKANHFLAFFVLSCLGYWSYAAGHKLATAIIMLAYGGVIEGLQAMTSYRSAEWGDLLADACGIALGLTLCQFLDSRQARSRSM
ncbi:MAG: VanZ family protein [Gallionellaceae bacterium]|nr:VanZ family protein [Gallionellaceae bacterium]